MTANTVKEQRAAYYQQLSTQQLSPLWESLHSLVPKEPQPQAKAAIWEYIAALRGAGRTVLVTTNVLDEAQHCDRIAIIDDGRVVRRPVTPAQLQHEHGGATVEQAFLRLTGTGLRD